MIDESKKQGRIARKKVMGFFYFGGQPIGQSEILIGILYELI